MGGCATKPKVLKDAAAAAAGGGAPLPVPEKEEGSEDLAAVKEGGVGADDEVNKRHSLSNLFKESEEKSLEDGKDEACETKQASESNPKETEKPKCAEEQNPAPVVDSPAKIEAEKAQELEASVEEKIEDVKPAIEGKKDEMPEMRTEEKSAEDTQKFETPVEEKTEEKPATPQIEDKKPPSTLEKTMEN